MAILGVERQRPAWTARLCREKKAEGANAGRKVDADLEEDEDEIRQRVRPAASRRIAISEQADRCGGPRSANTNRL